MSKRSLIIIVLGLIALRWIFPESDPAWWFNIEDLHDEAWWAENARRNILFNEWMWDEYAGAIASGPLAVVWHWINFKIWGISFFSLRLISLIPATLILLLLWFKNPFSNNDHKIGFYLLASSPAFFALNRVGYLETMLVFILLISITFIKFNKNWSSVLAGILFCAGLLFKGSFVFLLIPAIVWLWLDVKNRKQVYVALSTVIMVSLLIILFYFIPNQELFKPYLLAFSEDYIPANILYDPRGWIARLAWLPEKNLLSSPLACWLSIYFLIKVSRGNLPSFRSSAWGIFVLILIAALFTDFSDRRLSVLIVLMPFIVTEGFSVKIKTYQNLLIGFVLSLSLIPWLIKEIPIGDYNTLIHQASGIALAIVGFITLVYYSFKFMKVEFASLWILRIGITIWLLATIHYSAVKVASLLEINYWLLLLIHLIICIYLVIQEYQFYRFTSNKKILAFSFLSTQFILMLTALIFPSYTLRNAAQQLSQIVRIGERIAGPNNAVELSFLSQGKTYLYPPKNSLEQKVFAGYFNKNDSTLKMEHQNMLISEPNNTMKLLLFPLPNKFKAEGFIVYSRPLTEKK